MRTRLVALALLLGGVAPVWGQTSSGTGPAKKPPPVKSGLEDALVQALKSNPDLKVAAAKLNEAEAILYRTRLQVVQKVVMQHRAIEQAKAAVTSAETQYKRARDLLAKRAISREDFEQSERELAKAKARLADAEAEMAFLLGKSAARSGLSRTERDALEAYTRAFTITSDRDPFARAMASEQDKAIAALRLTKAASAIKGPMADKLRKALDRRMALKFTDATAEDVLKSFQKDHPEIPIRAVGRKGAAWQEKVTIDLKAMPFGAGLQLLEDTLYDHRIVVRDYGLLIVQKDHVPPGALLLHEFWKEPVAPQNPLDAEARKGTGKGPAENVEGQVKQVDAGSGLVTITLGSDAGLAKGHTLEVFRLAPTPKYLGMIEIAEVGPKQSVARVKGRSLGNIAVGDRVASRIARK